MINALSKLAIPRNFLDLMKTIYKKNSQCNIDNGEKLDTFP